MYYGRGFLLTILLALFTSIPLATEATVSVERSFWVTPDHAGKRQRVSARRSQLGPSRSYSRARDSLRSQLSRVPASLRSRIAHIERTWGPVKVVSVCRPGATFSQGGRRHPSWHAQCRAVDFEPPAKHRGAVLAYLRNTTPGYVLTYGWSKHLHIDNAREGRFAAKPTKPKQWPVAVAEKPKTVPLPPVRPVIEETLDVALLDTEAMPVAYNPQPKPEPVIVVLPPQNIFEAFADSLLRPVGNCKEWKTVAPGARRIVSDATRHFSRKYQRTLIAELTSCYRPAWYNRKIGGARMSAHIRRNALDFKITAPDHSFYVSKIELWQFCKSHPLSKGCGIYKSGIIHADVDRMLGKRAWDWRGRGGKKYAAKAKWKKKKFAVKKWKKAKRRSHA